MDLFRQLLSLLGFTPCPPTSQHRTVRVYLPQENIQKFLYIYDRQSFYKIYHSDMWGIILSNFDKNAYRKIGGSWFSTKKSRRIARRKYISKHITLDELRRNINALETYPRRSDIKVIVGDVVEGSKAPQKAIFLTNLNNNNVVFFNYDTGRYWSGWPFDIN